MNTVSKIWNPIKTGDQYSRKEILDTPIYQDIFLINPELPVDDVVALVRNCITVKFNASKSLAATIASFFAAIKVHGIVGNKVLLDRETLTAKALRTKTIRWRNHHYVKLIGQVFHRELQSRNDRKGIYTLYVEEPWPKSKVPFRARVVDPDGFETRYPPRRKTARETSDYLEVTSMSALTGKCKAKAGMAPSAFFGLGPAEPTEPEQQSVVTPQAKSRSIAASPVSSYRKHRIKYKITPATTVSPTQPAKAPDMAFKGKEVPASKPANKPSSFFY